MRWLRRALLVAVASLALPAAGSPRKLGPWGEDPAVVPDYAPVEERRAPKLYDNTRIFGWLQPRDAARLDDVLLVCHASVRGNWDFLGGPDVTLRFVFGREPAIKLWGPEIWSGSGSATAKKQCSSAWSRRVAGRG